MFGRVAVRLGSLSPVLIPLIWSMGTTQVEASPAREATILDLGSAQAGQVGRATALNDGGEIAGLLSIDTGNRGAQPLAAAWDGRTWAALGAGEALAINKHGEVAGFVGQGTQQQATT